MVVSCLVPIEASHLRDPPLLVQAACNVHNVHSSIIVLAQIQTPAPLLLAKVVDIIISPQKGSLLLCFPTPCPSMSTLPIQVSWLAPISPPPGPSCPCLIVAAGADVLTMPGHLNNRSPRRNNTPITFLLVTLSGILWRAHF